MSGLTEGTTYYYRATSKDAANNSASFPIISEPPLQFTYPFLSNDCARDGIAIDFGAGETGVNTEIVFEGVFVPDGLNKTQKNRQFSH